MKAAYKSNDPVEIRQDYRNLAAEIATAESQYAELGAKLSLMKENRDALGKHLSRIENPNARI